MVEKNLLLDKLEIRYKGLFYLEDLLKTINSLCSSKGYSVAEKRREQKVTETGREFSIELRASKTKQAEHTLLLIFYIHAKEVREVEVNINRIPARIEEGSVRVLVDAWEFTEFMGRWEQTPWHTFFRSLYHKFIKPHIGRYQGELINDCHYIYENIKAHLELHKYSVRD